MRIAYFDCFSGAAGDMIVGACVAAGADVAALKGELGKLKLDGVELHIDTVNKGGFEAVEFVPRLAGAGKKHRHLSHILQIIDQADLKPSVRDKAKGIFHRLAEAEAKVHGTSVEKIHFHEVGADDAICDIVGAAVALDLLDVERIVCSPLVVGGGTVDCDHGRMPVPAPATAELIKGVPLAESPVQFELLTPTGAAILTTLAESFGPMPAMKIASVGYGAGTRDIPGSANVLRLTVGETTESASAFPQDQVLVLETNLDDATPETVGHAMDRLLAAGALDVYAQPVQTKKNRPGCILTVLCNPDDQSQMEEILFTETSTFGVRRTTWNRSVLHRRHETVQTPYGPIRIKIGHVDDKIYTAAPEYEDCRQATVQHNVPLQTIYHAARAAYRKN